MQKLWPVEVCCQNLCRAEKLPVLCRGQSCSGADSAAILSLGRAKNRLVFESGSGRTLFSSSFFLALDRNRLGLYREGGGNSKEGKTLVDSETKGGGGCRGRENRDFLPRQDFDSDWKTTATMMV